MRMIKVRKKIFKREFLDFRLVVVVFDVCQMAQEEEPEWGYQPSRSA